MYCTECGAPTFSDLCSQCLMRGGMRELDAMEERYSRMFPTNLMSLVPQSKKASKKRNAPWDIKEHEVDFRFQLPPVKQASKKRNAPWDIKEHEVDFRFQLPPSKQASKKRNVPFDEEHQVDFRFQLPPVEQASKKRIESRDIKERQVNSRYQLPPLPYQKVKPVSKGNELWDIKEPTNYPPPSYKEAIAPLKVEKSKPKYRQINKTIHCGGRITHDHIRRTIRDLRGDLDDKDRKLLQEAAVLVSEESKWIFKNAMIDIFGENIDIKFTAGNGGNVYIIQLNGNDLTSRQLNQKNWRLALRDGFKSVFAPISPLINPPAIAIGAVALA